MHSTSLLSCLLLAVSIANGAPVYVLKRSEGNLGKRLTFDPENINGVKDSTPVLRTCTIENIVGQEQLTKNCGPFTVNGLTTRERGVGLQIACLTDEATCLKDGKAADECKKKRQTCEFENTTGRDFTRLNQDRSSRIDFVHTNDPVCNAEDKPLICTRRIADAGSGGLILEPLDEPSKFVEDNDTGATLIADGIKKGPIGEGLKTMVQDNGDSTFTAGNLTTFSRNFAIHLGCLFDKAECDKTESREECNKVLVDCNAKNQLGSRFLIIAQTRTKP